MGLRVCKPAVKIPAPVDDVHHWPCFKVVMLMTTVAASSKMTPRVTPNRAPNIRSIGRSPIASTNFFTAKANIPQTNSANTKISTNAAAKRTGLDS